MSYTVSREGTKKKLSWNTPLAAGLRSLAYGSS